MLQEEQVRGRIVRVESALTALGSQRDATSVRAMDVVESLITLYGECLARIMDALESEGQSELAQGLARDDLVSHLLLVHDLHPASLETRVESAVTQVRQSLPDGTGELDLVGVVGTTVRVRVRVRGCRSNVARIRQAVEEAVAATAPEIESVEVVEDAAQPVISAEALFSGGHVPEAG